MSDARRAGSRLGGREGGREGGRKKEKAISQLLRREGGKEKKEGGREGGMEGGVITDMQQELESVGHGGVRGGSDSLLEELHDAPAPLASHAQGTHLTEGRREGRR